MKICLVEPFHTGSHATWAEEYARYSGHDVTLLTLDGRHWKWRMHGGAVTLARDFMKGDFEADLLLVSDMLDLTTFLALTRTKTARLLMVTPEWTVESNEHMEEVARKFTESGRYNFPVLEKGKYLGFVSRARVFSSYRDMLKHFSED